MQMWLKSGSLGALVIVSMSLIHATAQAMQADDNINTNTNVSINSVPTLPHISAAQQGQHSLNFSQANNDEISEAIAALSQQAKAKEDALAQLAMELEQKHRQYEQAQQASSIRQKGILAALPVDGYRVSSNYGSRRIFGKSQFHKGIDLAAPSGSPVYATGDGVVTRAGWVSGYGQFVEIDHGAGLVSRYGHNSRLHVAVGDRVSVRQRIADVGCTGRCTGPHVHYEVLKDGQHTDPSIHLAMANK